MILIESKELRTYSGSILGPFVTILKSSEDRLMHMKWTKKQIMADAALGVVIIVIALTANEIVYKPLTEPYEFKTVAKVSNQYDQPIYFTFQWKTEEELQVGKLVTFNSTIRGLPYSSSDEPLKDISLKFDERQLNYWSNKTDTKNNGIFQKDSITFQPIWDEEVFRSDKVDLRFVIPTDITLEFCDFNIPRCINIVNVIHPAPHDLAVQIETNRIGLGLTLALAAFSSAIVWSKLRPN